MAKSKDDLLAMNARRYTECNGFRIQSLNDLEYSEWESKRVDYEKGKINTREVLASRRKFLVKVLVDDAGNRLFDDSEFTKLAAVDSGIIGDLYDAAMAHCGYEDSAKDIEDERKNSEATQD